MKLRTIALGLCAGLLAGPALAADVLVYETAPPPSGSPVYAGQSLVSADVLLAVGYYAWDDDDDAFDTDTWEGWATGRVNIPFGAAFNQEFEASVMGGFESDAYYTYGVFSHSYWKNEMAAAGLLLGAASLRDDGAYTVGAEGAFFLPTTTFVGLLAYTWADDRVPDFWTVEGEARWYWNPNNRLSGTAGYSDFGDSWSLRAGAEHRIPGTVASLFADATYYASDGGNGWEVFGGARLIFDKPGQSLQDYDHDVPFAATRALTF